MPRISLDRLSRLGLLSKHQSSHHPLARFDMARDRSGMFATKPVRSDRITARDRRKAIAGRKVRRAQLIAAKKR